MKLVVGLGNPGKEYEQTRHNVGFLVVDELKRRGIDQTRVRTLKPDTFMNLSGNAVAQALRQTNMTTDDVIVVYDDADLPFSEIRVRADGSSGGHNGMQSVIDHLGTNKIVRVRVGIGRPENINVPLDAWVLSKWTTDEEAKLSDIVSKAADEVDRLL